MRGNFETCFVTLMGNEGGYSNNPADPGGETMWGITKRVALKYGYTGAMRDLSQALAKTIAEKEYWQPIRGDELPHGLDFQVFDTCYNSGAKEAIILLQRALDFPHEQQDGAFGPKTMEKVKALTATVADFDRTVMRFDAYRLLFFCDLPGWKDFGRGWARRVANNLLVAAEN
jgi:lysozyme family protein